MNEAVFTFISRALDSHFWIVHLGLAFVIGFSLDKKIRKAYKLPSTFRTATKLFFLSILSFMLLWLIIAFVRDPLYMTKLRALYRTSNSDEMRFLYSFVGGWTEFFVLSLPLTLAVIQPVSGFLRGDRKDLVRLTFAIISTILFVYLLFTLESIAMIFYACGVEACL